MSQSEYLLGFIAILVGIAVADIAQSLHKLLRARARVRWHWMPLAASFLMILLTVEMWWSLTSLERLSTAMTAGRFLPMLLGLMVLILLASAVLPDSIPAEGIDLRTFYFAEHRYLWVLFALFVTILASQQIVGAWYFRGSGAAARQLSSVLPNVVISVLALGLSRTQRPIWHTLWLLLLPLILLVGLVTRPLM
jgi:hypothetical protein